MPKREDKLLVNDILEAFKKIKLFVEPAHRISS
jgi:uncharacterized protein with HEPN domain